MPAPIDSIEDFWSPAEKAQVSHMLSCAFVGSPDTVHGKLEQFLARTRADELMINAPIFDHQKRLHSIELLAGLGRSLG